MPNPTPEEIAKRNETTLNYFMGFWLDNARENAAYVNWGADHGKLAHRVPFEDKDPSKGIVIVASGPTLYEQREYLKDLNKYFVICSPTNYGLCAAHGLQPDLIAIADSSHKQIEDLFRIIDHPGRTKVVASPTVHYHIHKVWNKEDIYWFKSYIQSPDGTLKNPYNDFINKLFANVDTHILQAGNVTNMALILTELWRRMGRYGDEEKKSPPVFLVGADFCFREDGFRAPKYRQVDNRFECDPLPPISIDLDVRKVLKVDGKLTNEQMYNYRRSLLMLWVTTPWMIWNCSDYTQLKEVPHWSIKDLVEGNLPEPYDGIKHGKKVWEEYKEEPEPEGIGEEETSE